MAEIKICGLMREEDIYSVNRHLPEYAGIVFAAGRRRLELCEAVSLFEKLDSAIRKVGVFVNQDMDEVIYTAYECRLDIIQLHGDEDRVYIDTLRDKAAMVGLGKTEIWKALRVRNNASIAESEHLPVEAVVLDTWDECSRGGRRIRKSGYG